LTRIRRTTETIQGHVWIFLGLKKLTVLTVISCCLSRGANYRACFRDIDVGNELV
jgi:hypothetical protein